MSERSLAPATRPDPDPTQNPDPRYEYVTCPACGQRWQRIDWACTQHALSCFYGCGSGGAIGALGESLMSYRRERKEIQKKT